MFKAIRELVRAVELLTEQVKTNTVSIRTRELREARDMTQREVRRLEGDIERWKKETWRNREAHSKVIERLKRLLDNKKIVQIPIKLEWEHTGYGTSQGVRVRDYDVVSEETMWNLLESCLVAPDTDQHKDG